MPSESKILFNDTEECRLLGGVIAVGFSNKSLLMHSNERNRSKAKT